MVHNIIVHSAIVDFGENNYIIHCLLKYKLSPIVVNPTINQSCSFSMILYYCIKNISLPLRSVISFHYNTNTTVISRKN